MIFGFTRKLTGSGIQHLFVVCFFTEYFWGILPHRPSGIHDQWMACPGAQNPQFSSLGSICADESFLDTFWECNIFHEIVDQQTNNTSWANYNDLTVLKMGWWALFQVSELLQFSQIQCQSKWLASHPQKISELRRCFRFGCASQLLSGNNQVI